jgi:hypothetical protein
MGAITTEERAAVRARSPVGGKYDAAVNRESAYEVLGRRVPAETPGIRPGGAPAADRPARHPGGAPAEQPSGWGGKLNDMLFGTSRRQGMVEAMAKEAARTVGSQIGRQILRGVLGGILGGSRR